MISLAETNLSFKKCMISPKLYCTSTGVVVSIGRPSSMLALKLPNSSKFSRIISVPYPMFWETLLLGLPVDQVAEHIGYPVFFSVLFLGVTFSSVYFYFFRKDSSQGSGFGLGSTGTRPRTGDFPSGEEEGGRPEGESGGEPEDASKGGCSGPEQPSDYFDVEETLEDRRGPERRPDFDSSPEPRAAANDSEFLRAIVADIVSNEKDDQEAQASYVKPEKVDKETQTEPQPVLRAEVPMTDADALALRSLLDLGANYPKLRATCRSADMFLDLVADYLYSLTSPASIERHKLRDADKWYIARAHYSAVTVRKLIRREAAYLNTSGPESVLMYQAAHPNDSNAVAAYTTGLRKVFSEASQQALGLPKAEARTAVYSPRLEFVFGRGKPLAELRNLITLTEAYVNQLNCLSFEALELKRDIFLSIGKLNVFSNTEHAKLKTCLAHQKHYANARCSFITSLLNSARKSGYAVEPSSLVDSFQSYNRVSEVAEPLSRKAYAVSYALELLPDTAALIKARETEKAFVELDPHWKDLKRLSEDAVKADSKLLSDTQKSAVSRVLTSPVEEGFEVDFLTGLIKLVYSILKHFL